ncbi:TonB-dependent receptor [Sandarakinorhabdus sp.]|uniref:TonB-dependent receptor n=1 Tax=Sandarakinorhabdus sp. TaxID=1916663 RepID=UPI00286E8E25|nr:TonB-dependent receptor [Sandarakinorhabdus sp.]
MAGLLAAGPALAQSSPASPDVPELPAAATALTSAGNRTSENAVRQAGDAFGTTIGQEEIGLYSSSDVRGFSPKAAGNVRIAGLYFDPVFFPSDRISGSSTIRVGPTVFGSPFPSPTGIVDLGLRVPGDKAAASVLIGADTFGTRTLEADVALPVSDAFSLGIGGAANLDHMGDGTRDYYYEGALIARWRPAPGVEIVPFISLAYTPFHEAATIYVPDGDVLPPPLPRNFWNGPAWQRTRETELNAGVVADWTIGDGWSLKAGLFRSSIKYFADFTNLLTGVRPDGTAQHSVLADPPLLFASTSGEARLSRLWADGPRTHRFHVSVRGRRADRRFGGADTIDLGPATLTQRSTAPQPAFTFTAQEQDRVRQWTVGLGYEGRWDGVGELSLGLQRTDYRKRIGLPDRPPLETNERPLLVNANIALNVSSRLAVYGGFVTGLEESGVAPENAGNRNEALPAIRTRQFDAGLRWQPIGDMRLVAGLFQVSKPYFNLDASGRFRALGDVRNRGFEASVSGPVTKRLTIVAGTVLLWPSVDAGGIAGVGPRPVGAVSRRFAFSADWRPPQAPGLSLDLNVNHQSAQTATVSNLTEIPAQTFVDIGGRYAFRLAGKSATVRVQVENLFGFQGYELFGAGAFRPVWGRAARTYLTIDL